MHAALQVLGDRWSLLIVRDMAFHNRRTFGELLEHNREGIASNILDARLKHLEAAKVIWAATYMQPGPDRNSRIVHLQYGGALFMEAFLHELARTHLRLPRFAGYLRLAPQTGGPIGQALSLAEIAGRPRMD